MPKYTFAYCTKCKCDKTVYATGITPCPECGSLLFPCSACQECLYDACPYDGKNAKELEPYINRNPIAPKTATKFIRKHNRQFHRHIWFAKRRKWWRDKFSKNEFDDLPI